MVGQPMWNIGDKKNTERRWCPMTRDDIRRLTHLVACAG